MSRKKANSRVLRQIAKDTIEKVAAEVPIPDGDRGDLVTSLVRQWITYDGRATFFLDEGRQVYLTLDRTPLGKSRVGTEWIESGLIKLLYEHWKVGPDDIHEVMDQLNRGQSADVVNADGVALRLWVNPKDRRSGVEPVDREDHLRRMPPQPDYTRMATNFLKGYLRGAVDDAELTELAGSVARQWQQFEHHACIFLDARQAVLLTVKRDDDGLFTITAARERADIGRCLTACGIRAEDVPDMLVRINRGEEVVFRDGTGNRYRLQHDPKGKRFFGGPLDARRPPVAAGTPPVLCPKCSAVLDRWCQGQQRQACRFCGHTVSLS